MKFADATKVITHYNSSELARSERNDCSVRAFAGLLDTKYEPAHSFVADKFDRINRQGTLMMPHTCNKMASEGDTYTIDGVSFKFHTVPVNELINTYKLKGEHIERKKTVKSFVQSHEQGSYLVFVSGHVFAVKDGTVIDNASDEYKPTRKVIAAIKVEMIDDQMELELF